MRSVVAAQREVQASAEAARRPAEKLYKTLGAKINDGGVQRLATGVTAAGAALGLGVGLAELFMPAFADHLAVLDENASDHRVRLDGAAAVHREAHRPPQKLLIDRRDHQRSLAAELAGTHDPAGEAGETRHAAGFTASDVGAGFSLAKKLRISRTVTPQTSRQSATLNMYGKTSRSRPG